MSKLTHYVSLFSFCLFWMAQVYALEPPVQFIEDNQFILAVTLQDGLMVSDGVDVYRAGNNWFLPLTSFVESLGLAITVSPALGRAEGFYLEESNLFKFSKETCTAEIFKKTESFDCEQTITRDDEIYVEAKILEKWFRLKIEIDPYSSQMIVFSAQKFPKQLRLERDRQAESLTTHQNEAPKDYQEEELTDKYVGEGSFDQQLTVGRNRLGENEQGYFRHDTIAAIELLGFETKGFLGGESNQITKSSLSISKKDPHAHLLGPLRARSIELLDLTLPSLPLITSSVRAQGLLVSSFPLNQPTSFTSRDFRGPLPSNWEVELYQNDILIGRRVTDTATEYEFKDVSLYYGINRFRTVFYGPQGQRKENVEVIQVGQQATKPAESYYRVGSGVLVDDSDQVQTMAQYRHGVSSQLSAGLNYFQIHNKETQLSTDYGLIDISGGFSRFYATLNISGNSDNGSAGEVTVQAPFERFTIGASHAQLSQFRSPLYNNQSSRFLTQVNKFNGNLNTYPYLPIRFDGEYLLYNFDDGTKTSEIRQRTSWQILRSYWFNTLTVNSEESRDFTGQLLTIVPIERYEFRASVDYADAAEILRSSIEYRLSDRYSYELELTHDLTKNLTSSRGTLNRLFNYVTLSAELSGDSQGDYRAIGLISYSGTYDPRKHRLEFSPRSQTSYGAASARVFLDHDLNGLFSEGDEPLEDVAMRVNQNDVDSRTDSMGETMLLQLPSHQPTDITLSLKSLPDPFYKSSKKGIRLIPRPGQVSMIEFPVVIESEISGMIQIDKSNGLRGLRNITVILKDLSGEVIASAKTESDGYYLIEGVLPGDYLLILDLTQPETMNLDFDRSLVPIKVTRTGLVESTFDFRAYDIRSKRR